MSAPPVCAALDAAGEPRVLAALRRRADGRVAVLLDPELLTAPARDGAAVGRPGVPCLGHTGAPPPRGWAALFDGVAHADNLPSRPGTGALRPVDLVFLGASPSAEDLHGAPWYAPGGGRYAPRVLSVRPPLAAAWIDRELGAAVALGELTERERNLAELVAEAWHGAAGPIARWLGASVDRGGAGLEGASLASAIEATRAAVQEVLEQGRSAAASLADAGQLDGALTHEAGGFALDLAHRGAAGGTQLLRLGLARFAALPPPSAGATGPVLVFERLASGESTLARIVELAPYLVELCAAPDALRTGADPDPELDP
ncbi:MAG: hypothetical protein GC161_05080 [Planctomycetaceae bacterium]|nr:hypothetical protein [Planctomycetaceae bacterium]